MERILVMEVLVLLASCQIILIEFLNHRRLRRVYHVGVPTHTCEDSQVIRSDTIGVLRWQADAYISYSSYNQGKTYHVQVTSSLNQVSCLHLLRNLKPPSFCFCSNGQCSK